MTGKRRFDASPSKRLIAALFFAKLMALQFDIEIAAAKDRGKPISKSYVRMPCPCCASAAASGPSSPPVRQISPAENSSKIFKRRGAFSLGWFPHFEARNELAKVLIARLRCAEQQ